MRCKAIERLILEAEERPLLEDERRALDRHLPGCRECRGFEAGRAALRQALGTLPSRDLPKSLDLGTRRACLAELGAAREGEEAEGRRANVPWPVVVASALFALLAAVWLTATLGDLTPDESLPTTAWLAIAFMAQTVFLLFLAPVIFRAARRPDAEDAQTS